MYVCMFVVLRSVYLSGTACGLVWSRAAVPVRLSSLCCCFFQRHAAMYVCMYGQQVQRSYLVELFCRPDLTSFYWL